MLFSIVTATYNAESTIADTIESVINSGITDYEHIIIDGVSTDKTVEIASSYSSSKIIIITEADCGIYDAMNKGIRLAQGDLVATLNADDFYIDGALAQIRDAFESNPDAGVFYGNILYEKNKSVKVRYPAIQETNYNELCMPVWHPATFIRKSIYEQYGFYDTNYQIAADYDYLLGLYKSGVNFCYVDRVITHMRWGGASIKKWKIQHEEDHRIHLKYKLSIYLRWRFKYKRYLALCRSIAKPILGCIGIK